MDENKDVENRLDTQVEENLEKINDEQNLEENKQNPFKDRKFYLGFFGSLIPFLLFCIIANGEAWMFAVGVLCIPYLIVSFVVWSMLNTNHRAFALGILLAGIASFVLLLLLMGGCILSIGEPYEL